MPWAVCCAAAPATARSLMRLLRQMTRPVVSCGTPMRAMMRQLPSSLVDDGKPSIDVRHGTCHLLGDTFRQLALPTPRRVVDVFPDLFAAAINDSNRIMATGEALAHMNYLLHAGEVTAEYRDDAWWYEAR